MAIKGEINIKNHEGTELKGPRENGSSLIYEFNHEVYLPYEKEESNITGARKIRAFNIVKGIDKLTPQLYQIVCKGQVCKEIKVTLYTIGKEGKEKPYFHVLLKDVLIVSVQNWMPPTYDPKNEGIGHLEKVSMIGKTISWEFIDGGIIYEETAF